MRPIRLGPSRDAARSPAGGARDDDAEDARLVARACDRDRAAEEAIYRRHVGYVGGMVMRLLANASEAEDVVQDTFALALEQLPRLREGTALRPWLAQIAVSQVHRRFRRRRLMRLAGLDRRDEPVALDAIASDDAPPDVRSELAALGRRLAALRPNERIAWSLRYVEGSTLQEVASACGCSLATAKRRIATADAYVRQEVRLDDGVVALPLRDGVEEGS